MERKSERKLFGIVFFFCVFLMMAITGAIAEEIVESGSCGEYANYTLSADGTLRITGSGMITGSFQDRRDILHLIIEEGITGNQGGAFSYCPNIQDISLPSTYISLDNRTFYSNQSLISASIPEGVTEIGFECFGYCTSLTTVYLPANLQRIGDSGFDYGCQSLTDVYFAGTTTQWNSIEIGDDNAHLMMATIHCSDGDIVNNVTMALEDGVLTISGNGYMGNIPNEYFIAISVRIGAGVTGGLFYDAFENLNDHVVSYEVEHGNKAYASVDGALFTKNYETLIIYPGANKSKSFSVPSGTRIIGERSFQNNKYLSSVTLPEGLEKILNAAFFSCSELTGLSIPASVSFIDNLSFVERCYKLTCINVAEDNEKYTSVDGVLFSKDLLSMMRYPAGLSGNYTVPKGVESLDGHAFLGSKLLTSVTLPEGLTEIQTRVFYDCTALTEINLPASLTYIDSKSFTGCQNLRNVYFAGNVSQWADVDICSDNTDLLFCTIHCDGSDVEPNSVTGTCGEYGSGSVTYVLTPGGQLTVSGTGGINSSAFVDNYRVVIAILVNGITKINSRTFANCANLEEITIPATLTQIAPHAFSNCDALKTINFGGTVEQWKALSANYYDGEYASNNRLAKLKVSCSDGVYDPATEIVDRGKCGENVTYSLTADGIMHVSGTGAMYDYDDWSPNRWGRVCSVIISEGVTSIGELAFYGCHDLTTISLPDSLTTIGDWAVYSCDLESVTIPKNVSSIGTWAFSSSSRLTEITVAEDNPYFSTYDGALYNKEKTILLICPAGKTTISIPDGVICIDKAVQACHKLISVNLPEGITSIGGYTFSNLQSLTSVTIPRSMREFKNYAFKDCPSLTDVYYNGTVEEWEQITIYKQNEPLFASMCIIHCTDRDTKAQPSNTFVTVYSDYSESGFYLLPNVPLGGYVEGRLFSDDTLFSLSVDSSDSGSSEEPQWSISRKNGTAKATINTTWSTSNAQIIVTELPEKAETATWHVVCTIGNDKWEKDLSITFKKTPTSLPLGVNHVEKWIVKAGEALNEGSLFRFRDGWTVDSLPVSSSIYGGTEDFWNAVEQNYQTGKYIAVNPGEYNCNILVSCANICWNTPVTLNISEINGELPGQTMTLDLAMEDVDFYLVSGENACKGLAPDIVFSETLINSISVREYSSFRNKQGGKPKWSIVKKTGTAKVSITEFNISNYVGASIHLEAFPTGPEDDEFTVTCTWGKITASRDFTVHFKNTGCGLPTGVTTDFGNLLVCRAGEELISAGRAVFMDGWALEGEEVNVRLAGDIMSDSGMQYNEIPTMSGTYNKSFIVVRCANIQWAKPITVIVTQEDGIIPIASYKSPGGDTLRIPNKLTNIPDEAFRGTDAQVVILPHCTSIGAYAFADAPRLRELQLSKELKVTAIDEYAFDECPELTIVVARTADQIQWALAKDFIVVDDVKGN